MTLNPFNLGDAYERKIFGILSKIGCIPPGGKPAGAGTGTDIIFLHKKQMYNLDSKKVIFLLQLKKL
jgi:hypothetical protein